MDDHHEEQHGHHAKGRNEARKHANRHQMLIGHDSLVTQNRRHHRGGNNRHQTIESKEYARCPSAAMIAVGTPQDQQRHNEYEQSRIQPRDKRSHQRCRQDAKQSGRHR